MSLDRRRQDEARLKARAHKKVLSCALLNSGSGKIVGVTYTTHGSKCSCWMCGNPRRHFGSKTLGEKRAAQDITI